MRHDAHARNYIFSTDRSFTDAISNDQRLSKSARLLGFVLDSLGDGAPVNPAAAELMLLCGFRTKTTLIAARVELERNGYICVERKSGRISRYILVLNGEVRS